MNDNLKQHVLRIGLAAAIGLAIPTAAALAKGPDANNKGQSIAAQHKSTNSKPTNTGKPAGKGKPVTAGSRPHNHGWVSSQLACIGSTNWSQMVRNVHQMSPFDGLGLVDDRWGR